MIGEKIKTNAENIADFTQKKVGFLVVRKGRKRNIVHRKEDIAGAHTARFGRGAEGNGGNEQPVGVVREGDADSAVVAVIALILGSEGIG